MNEQVRSFGTVILVWINLYVLAAHGLVYGAISIVLTVLFVTYLVPFVLVYIEVIKEDRQLEEIALRIYESEHELNDLLRKLDLDCDNLSDIRKETINRWRHNDSITSRLEHARAVQSIHRRFFPRVANVDSLEDAIKERCKNLDDLLDKKQKIKRGF